MFSSLVVVVKPCSISVVRVTFRDSKDAIRSCEFIFSNVCQSMMFENEHPHIRFFFLTLIYLISYKDSGNANV